MKYDVFVSYRHVRPDADVARAVARLVEGYVVAGSVGGVVKRRGFRVFRDVEELASGELGVLIESALAESEFLVVVCSPRTAGSVWCMREVEFFSRVRGVDHVLAVVVEGDPGVVVGDVVGGDVLAVDVRAGAVRSEGFGGFEGCGSGVVDRLVRQSVGVLRRDGIDRLMAGVVGVSLGDLRQRQRERRMRRITAATAAAALVMGGIGVSVTGLWLRARSAERAAHEESATVTMRMASETIASGDRIRGLLYAKEAWKKADPDSPSYDALRTKYYENLAEGAVYPAMTVLSKIDTGAAGDKARMLVVLGSGDLFLTAGEGAHVTMWSASTGRRVKTIDVEGRPLYLEKTDSHGGFLVMTKSGKASVFDAEGKRLSHFKVKLGASSSMRASVVRGRLYLPYKDGGNAHIAAYDIDKGTVLFDKEFPGFESYDVQTDGKEFAVSYEEGGAFRYDSTGNEKEAVVSREEDAARRAEGRKRSSNVNGLVSYAFGAKKLLYYSATHLYRVDTATGERLTRHKDSFPTRVVSLSLSDDGRWAYLVGGGTLLSTSRIDLSDEYARSLDFALPNQKRGKREGQIEDGVLLSGQSLFIGVNSDNSIAAWDPRSSGVVSIRAIGKTDDLGAQVAQVRVTKDASKLLSLGKDGTVNVVDVRGTDRSYEGKSQLLARSNDRRRIYGYDGVVGFVHEAGTRRGSDAAPPYSLSRVAVSNSGTVAWVSRENADRLTVSHGRKVLYSPEEKVGTEYTGNRPLAVFGRGDDVVYVTAKGKVVRHDASGKRESYLDFGGEVLSLRASEDGSLLAVTRSNQPANAEASWQIFKVDGGRSVAMGSGEMLSVVGRAGKLESTLSVGGGRIVRRDSRGEELSNVALPSGVRSDGEVLFEGSEDGTEVVVPSSESSYFVIDARTGKVLRRISTDARYPRAFISGRRIVYSVLGTDLRDGFKETEMHSLAQLEKTADKVLGGRRLSEEDKEEIR